MTIPTKGERNALGWGWGSETGGKRVGGRGREGKEGKGREETIPPQFLSHFKPCKRHAQLHEHCNFVAR